MEGTPNAVLAHSYSHKMVEYVEVNGLRVGEIGMEAAEAGVYGFPTVMVSGDEAACREAQALLGDIEIAPVKKGYGVHWAECLHPSKARALIKTKVIRALNRLSDFKPFVIPGPVKIVVREKAPLSAEKRVATRKKPHAKIIDDYTIEHSGRNVVEAFARRCGLDYDWPED